MQHIRPLHHHHTIISAQAIVQLAVAGVDRVHLRRAVLQQAIREPADVAAEIRADEPGHIHTKFAQRMFKLHPRPRNILLVIALRRDNPTIAPPGRAGLICWPTAQTALRIRGPQPRAPARGYRGLLTNAHHRDLRSIRGLNRLRPVAEPHSGASSRTLRNSGTSAGRSVRIVSQMTWAFTRSYSCTSTLRMSLITCHGISG